MVSNHNPRTKHKWLGALVTIERVLMQTSCPAPMPPVSPSFAPSSGPPVNDPIIRRNWDCMPVCVCQTIILVNGAMHSTCWDTQCGSHLLPPTLAKQKKNINGNYKVTVPWQWPVTIEVIPSQILKQEKTKRKLISVFGQYSNTFIPDLPILKTEGKSVIFTFTYYFQYCSFVNCKA